MERIMGPPVVCICGSGRFAQEMARQRRKLTLEWKIVIGPEIKADGNLVESSVTEDKFALDALHFHKINISDEVFVVDVNTEKPDEPPYIGDSTKREVAYAEQMGKPVVWLSRVLIQQGCQGSGSPAEPSSRLD